MDITKLEKALDTATCVVARAKACYGEGSTQHIQAVILQTSIISKIGKAAQAPLTTGVLTATSYGTDFRAKTRKVSFLGRIKRLFRKA
jgi:hypothetical protein